MWSELESPGVHILRVSDLSLEPARSYRTSLGYEKEPPKETFLIQNSNTEITDRRVHLLTTTTADFIFFYPVAEVVREEEWRLLDNDLWLAPRVGIAEGFVGLRQ